MAPEKSSTMLSWTEDELKFLPKFFAEFESQISSDELGRYKEQVWKKN